jgi:Fe-S cluster biogenesis protein NfuA
VASEKEFQEKIRQLGTLVGDLDQIPGGGSKGPVRELVQLLMEVHRTGLERMMELVFDAGETGEAIIRNLGQDPVVRSLLLLYSLHPDDLETRVMKALDVASAPLRKFDSKVELLGIQDGAVQVRLHTSGHACGSTTKNLQSIVEERIYDMAPDLTSLEILGPGDEASSGFVSLESLLKRPSPIPALATQGLEVEGAD